MRILDYFDVIMYPIEQFVNLLKDNKIAEYLFDGQVTLWQVIITFFVGALVIKFILAPVRLHFSGSSTPANTLTTAERYEDNRNAAQVHQIYSAYNGDMNGKL